MPRLSGSIYLISGLLARRRKCSREIILFLRRLGDYHQTVFLSCVVIITLPDLNSML